MTLRCGNCNYYLGETWSKLVYVGHCKRATDSPVEPPRDLRLCKSCGRINAFVPLSSLDVRRGTAVP